MGFPDARGCTPRSHLNGIEIIVHPDRPKYQLPDDVCVPDWYRVEFNEWARSFFGTRNLVDDGVTYMMEGRMVMNPRTYAALKAATSR